MQLIKYGARLVKWTKEELKTIGKKTRETMTMHRALHLQADVDRLYIPRNNIGRGMISVEDCCRDGSRNPEEVCRKQHKTLLHAVERERTLAGGEKKNEALEARNKNFMKKSFHSQFKRKMDEVRSQET